MTFGPDLGCHRETPRLLFFMSSLLQYSLPMRVLPGMTYGHKYGYSKTRTMGTVDIPLFITEGTDPTLMSSSVVSQANNPYTYGGG